MWKNSTVGISVSKREKIVGEYELELTSSILTSTKRKRGSKYDHLLDDFLAMVEKMKTSNTDEEFLAIMRRSAFRIHNYDGLCASSLCAGIRKALHTRQNHDDALQAVNVSHRNGVVFFRWKC